MVCRRINLITRPSLLRMPKLSGDVRQLATRVASCYPQSTQDHRSSTPRTYMAGSSQSLTTAMLQKLLRLICFSPMQTYYLCLLFLGLVITCVYLLITITFSSQPRLPCANSLLHHRNASSLGFLVALDYSDQLTGGGMNLFCLQCLASVMDQRLEVVEPFIVSSTFGMSLDFNKSAVESPWLDSTLRLGDVYDIEKWLAFSDERCFAPLASWERFLEAAPRDVILVQHSWANCSLTQFEKKYDPFFTLVGFNVIRKVCFNFQSSGMLNLWRYKRSIYGASDPANVTVIFNRWMGVEQKISKFTVSVTDSYCEKEVIGGALFNGLHVIPSSRLQTDVARYMSRYLHKAEGSMYIAIMVRIEQVFVGTSSRVNKPRLLSRCLDNVVQKWVYMKQHSGLDETFVALDYGRYGSKGFQLHSFMNRKQLEEKLKHMLQALEQGSFQEWEERFGEVTGTQNPGYIASLQQTIASKARCLITAGGGSFQNHAFVQHKEVYGNSCHIRLKKNCRLLDSWVSLSPPSPPSPSTQT